MNDERDEIRARVDIVALVGSSIRLEKKGKSYKGLCPFHADKNPSFDVNPTTGRYTCWSCGEKGDIFTWVMKTQNVEFPEALRTLAKMAGITLSERSRGSDTSQREVHHAAMAEAQAFFREQLSHSEAAMAYCARRGLTPDVLETWGIGYSPEGGQALTARLKRKGLALAECKLLFLVEEDRSGGYYDKFRSRLMFPISNEKGELVAFGGRLLVPGEPKYINSSDTPLYSKSRVLYGMNRARDALQKSKRAVLVEGYLDVIACHRAGVTSALASLGTSMSVEQAKLLKRWVEEVVILYDSDAAGQKAAERASRMLATEGLKVRVALMPDGEDPDTLLATSGSQAVQDAVERGLSPLEYRLQALERKYPEKGEDFWRELIPILAEAPTALELEKHALGYASQYPGVLDIEAARKALQRDVRQYRATHASFEPMDAMPTPRPAPQKPASIREQMSSSEIHLFVMFIDESSRAMAWRFASHSQLFLSELAVRLSEGLGQTFGLDAPIGPPSLWMHRLEAEELQSAIEQLATAVLDEPPSEGRLAEILDKLRLAQLQRKFNNGRNPEMTSAERLELLNLQRKMKPDKHQKPPTDGLF